MTRYRMDLSVIIEAVSPEAADLLAEEVTAAVKQLQPTDLTVGQTVVAKIDEMYLGLPYPEDEDEK